MTIASSVLAAPITKGKQRPARAKDASYPFE
jgi:hypothetical protein